jgi:ParB-like chromosome segregation protein Spo0J
MNVPLADRCTCHHWLPLAEIGDWPQKEVPVRKRAAQPQIWEPSYRELSREELRDRVRTAGGIRCEYALEARKELDGHIELVNGVHRWAIATELGIDLLPVRIIDASDSPMPAPY